MDNSGSGHLSNAIASSRDRTLTYQRLIRPLLFALSAESSHSLARLAMRLPPVWKTIGNGPFTDPRLSVEVHGMSIPNPIGLAPGFDKDCDFLEALAHLGFGFLAPGSVMGSPRTGNPRPRLARMIEDEGILNCMGLPSKGIDHALTNLRALETRRVPIFVDVLGETPSELLANFTAVQGYADAIEISLVCPNDTETEKNADPKALKHIVSEVDRRREKPVFAKIPLPIRNGSPKELGDFLDLCIEASFAGVIACGAQRVNTDKLSLGTGQLGGRPILHHTLQLVRQIRQYAGNELTIIASGGISSGLDAYRALSAGAQLLEIYSALVYRGWRAPDQINAELLDVFSQKGIGSMTQMTHEIRGDV